MTLGRIRTLVRKEFLELRRSPQLLRLVLIAPVVQLTILGYAATTDVKNVPIVVVDGDRSPRSRQIIERFAVSPYFDIVREETDSRAVDADLALNRAWLALIVPGGFGAAIDGATGREGAPVTTLQVIADGTDANSSGVALAYVQGLVGDFNRGLTAERGGPPPAIDGRVRVWFNPDLESRNFMIPGVLALLLLLITTNLTSMAIVREREMGTLDQLNVTPIGRWELILGKLLPYALVGCIDVVLVVMVAVYWFEVPLRGSVWLLGAASLTYLLCTLGLGLLVSTISSTQQQAMMTSTFFFLIPMMYLLGFIFPIENMPRVIQWVTTVIPLRYFLVIVRGIFLKGVGWQTLWPQFAALGAWGVAVLTLAAARSGNELDRMHIHVGTSGYNYPEWRGTFYPEKLKSAEMFGYYAERFRTVEINATFYRAPTLKTTTAWHDQAPDGFTYAMKAPRRITHDTRLKPESADSVAFFCESARALGPHLGPLLFQLPPNFKCDLTRFRAFLALLPQDLRAAFEFRHDSWLTAEVYALLREHGSALCVADFGDHATPLEATARYGYFRLRDEGYTPPDLERWAERIAERQADWEEVFVYFKHEDAGKGPEFARAFLDILMRRGLAPA